MVILDFSDTVYIDDSAALVVEQLVDNAIAQDTKVIVMGLTGLPADTLKALNVLRQVQEDDFADNMDDAREAAQRILKS